MIMNQQHTINVFQNEESLAEAAAELLIAIATHAIEGRGRFVVSLSGGTTPERLYALLATPPYCNRMPWNNTFIFWGDERCVPSDDDQNNAHMAKLFLLDHIDIPSTNIHPIPVDLEPEIAAKKYEDLIKKFFGEDTPRFDLIFLGLGENGHTASLFPGSDAIFENKRLVKEVYVGEQHMYRITMTPPLINQAHTIIFLVEGENKAAILNTVLTGPQQPNKFPAQIINAEDGNLYWFVDKKAATLLPDSIEQHCYINLNEPANTLTSLKHYAND